MTPVPKTRGNGAVSERSWKSYCGELSRGCCVLSTFWKFSGITSSATLRTAQTADASDTSKENPAKAPASVQSTDGPSAFKGVLGKNLQDSSAGEPSFWTEDIVEFQPIEGDAMPDFSDKYLKVLANNVQYLFKIFNSSW